MPRFGSTNLVPLTFNPLREWALDRLAALFLDPVVSLDSSNIAGRYNRTESVREGR